MLQQWHLQTKIIEYWTGNAYFKNISIFTQNNQHKYTESSKYGDYQDYFIILWWKKKWNAKLFLSHYIS